MIVWWNQISCPQSYALFMMILITWQRGYTAKVEICTYCNGKFIRLQHVCFRKHTLLTNCLQRMAQVVMVKQLSCKLSAMCWGHQVLRRLLSNKHGQSHQTVMRQQLKVLYCKPLIRMLRVMTQVVCLNCMVTSSNFVRSCSRLCRFVFLL